MSTNQFIPVKTKFKEPYIKFGKNESKLETKSQMINRIAELSEANKELEIALRLACERLKYFEELQDQEMGVTEFFGEPIDYDIEAFIEEFHNLAKYEMNKEVLIYVRQRHCD